MNLLTEQAPIPAHVPAHLVRDFNLYAGPEEGRTLHDWVADLHATAPDIFYTPALGGHWVVTRFDDAARILFDGEGFSSRQRLPKAVNPYQMIPLNLDPPDHRAYRQILTRFFSSKTVANLNPKIRDWAVRLIEEVAPNGQCDFSDQLAGVFPVSIFMEMMGLPLAELETFRGAVVEYFGPLEPQRRVELEQQIHDWMRDLVAARRAEPRDDLATELLSADINGRALTADELKSMTFLLFIAGMDTVANAMMFAFRHLGDDPALQAQLAAEPVRISNFVEETLRRYSIMNVQRMAKRDIVVGDVEFRAGDMVLCLASAAGLDPRKHDDPMRFDIDRRGKAHLSFSTGVHTCAGQFLGRTEMRIFIEEWIQRIPSFHIADGPPSRERAAQVMALEHLRLEWRVR